MHNLNSRLPKLNCLFIVIFALLFSITNSYAQEESDSNENEESNELKGAVYQAKKYRDILRLIEAYHYRELDIDSLSEATFEMMMQSLDNFSHFYDKQQYIDQRKTDRGTSVSAGFNYMTVDKKALVYNVYDGGAAAESGIKQGSLVLSIDGQDVTGKNLGKLSELLNGEEGSESTLVLDYFGRIDTFSIKRKPYVLSSITTSFAAPRLLDYGVGLYAKLSRFSDETAGEFEALLDSLSLGMDIEDIGYAVIDLRGNAGGKLDAARDLATFFMDSNTVVTKTKARADKFVFEMRTQERGLLHSVPVIVLTDEVTASSSEIFAGAIQDHDLGVLVGQKTFGKGIVQNTWDFNDSTGIRFTVASYSTPSGREVEPRIEYDESAIDESIYFGMNEKQKAAFEEQIKIYGTSGRVGVFKTENGRTVIELKGIKPDIETEEREYSKMHQLLESKKMYYLSAYVFAQNNPELFSIVKGMDKESYIAYYEIPPDLVESFGVLAKNNSLWNDEMYDMDNDIMHVYLKAELGHLAFGGDTASRILALSDPKMDRVDEFVREAIKIRNYKADN